MTAQPTAQTAPAVFNFTAITIRVITDEHGAPWFAVADVCDVLGHTNSRKALADHCRAEGVTKRDTPTPGGMQPLTYIDEGNLYRLIIKSRKPEAAKFEAWICDDVLPTIRKTGRYQAQPIPAPSLGPVGEWITQQHANHAARYLYRSGGAAASAIRAGIHARFGLHARDLPAARLPELLDALDSFGDDCYRLWQVSVQLEAIMLADWKTRSDTLPPTIKALMAQIAVPSGPGTTLANVRESVRAMLPGALA